MGAPVLSQCLTVIRCQDDHRRVSQPEALDAVEDTTDLGIGEGDGAVVHRPDQLDLLFCEIGRPPALVGSTDQVVIPLVLESPPSVGHRLDMNLGQLLQVALAQPVEERLAPEG